MIEVERKFFAKHQYKNNLIKDARFIKKFVFTDVYYDTKDFLLTTKDIWLRVRNDRFELKLPYHRAGKRLVDQYEEIEDEQKIRTVLKLPFSGNFADDLVSCGFLPFCTCTTTRERFKKGLFNIDFDTVDFKNFIYRIVEIELLAEDQSKVKSAVAKIIAFAKKHSLSLEPVRGKVIEYLKRFKPNHYQALVRAGVVGGS